MVKHPCQGCIYYKTCGESTRTAPCEGRKTKREAEKEKRYEELLNRKYNHL